MIKMETEIKKYCNRHLYSDALPYEVLKVVSPKCVVIRGMKATMDPSWKQVAEVGGFSAFTVNNYSQRWKIESDLEAGEIRVRLHKDGYWRDKWRNRHIMADEPIKFYDFNF
jgi:hypothetical protein